MSIFYIFLYTSEGKLAIYSCCGTRKQNIFCSPGFTMATTELADVAATAATHDDTFTCWNVIAIVFMSMFFMVCLLHYQRLCHCLAKRERKGFLRLDADSRESLEEEEGEEEEHADNKISRKTNTPSHHEMKRMDCGCCEVLFNTGGGAGGGGGGGDGGVGGGGGGGYGVHNPDKKLVYIKHGESIKYGSTNTRIANKNNRQMTTTEAKSATDEAISVTVSYNKTCAVCLEQFRPSSKMVRLKCGHSYHKRCKFPF